MVYVFHFLLKLFHLLLLSPLKRVPNAAQSVTNGSGDKGLLLHRRHISSQCPFPQNIHHLIISLGRNYNSEHDIFHVPY